MLEFLLRLLYRKSYRRLRNDIDVPDVIRIETSEYLNVSDLSEALEKDIRLEILLTEYKETIDTLRNWDRITFQVLTIVGTVVAALISLSVQQDEPIAWPAILSLILFWLFTYVYLVKLSEVRVTVLIEIENELEMKGQYRKLREIKQARTLTVWLVLPLVGALILGPTIGFIISNPSLSLAYMKSIWDSIISLIR